MVARRRERRWVSALVHRADRDHTVDARKLATA